MKTIDNTPINNFDEDWGDPEGDGKKGKSLGQVQIFLKNELLKIDAKIGFPVFDGFTPDRITLEGKGGTWLDDGVIMYNAESDSFVCLVNERYYSSWIASGERKYENYNIFDIENDKSKAVSNKLFACDGNLYYHNGTKLIEINGNVGVGVGVIKFTAIVDVVPDERVSSEEISIANDIVWDSTNKRWLAYHVRNNSYHTAWPEHGTAKSSSDFNKWMSLFLDSYGKYYLKINGNLKEIPANINGKQDRMTRREVSGIGSIAISPNEYTIITLNGNVTINMAALPKNRTYAEHYEFDIITGDEVYEVGFAYASSYTWAKELVIEPNKIYKFYVDDDYTIIWQAIERSDI